MAARVTIPATTQRVQRSACTCAPQPHSAGAEQRALPMQPVASPPVTAKSLPHFLMTQTRLQPLAAAAATPLSHSLNHALFTDPFIIPWRDKFIENATIRSAASPPSSQDATRERCKKKMSLVNIDATTFIVHHNGITA